MYLPNSVVVRCMLGAALAFSITACGSSNKPSTIDLTGIPGLSSASSLSSVMASISSSSEMSAGESSSDAMNSSSSGQSSSNGVVVESPIKDIENGDKIAPGMVPAITIDDPDAVSVKVIVDGMEIGTKNEPPFTFTPDEHGLNDPDVADGEHTIVIIVTDKDGNMTETVVTVDIENPVVVSPIKDIEDGQVFAPGAVPDIVIEDPEAESVKITVDGEEIGTKDEAPFIFSSDEHGLNDPEVPEGEHTVVVDITDKDGNTEQTVVTITIGNAASSSSSDQASSSSSEMSNSSDMSSSEGMSLGMSSSSAESSSSESSTSSQMSSSESSMASSEGSSNSSSVESSNSSQSSDSSSMSSSESSSSEQSSSSDQSSSASSSAGPTGIVSELGYRADFLYPTQFANFGGFETSTDVAVVVTAPEGGAVVVGIEGPGGMTFDDDQGTWKSTTPLTVAVNDSTTSYEFTITTEAGDKDKLVLRLNNRAGSAGGPDPLQYTVGNIALDTDDRILYFTDPLEGKLVGVNLATGEFGLVDVSEYANDAFNPSAGAAWPIGVDSANNIAYIAEDTTKDAEANLTDKTVSLVSIDLNTAERKVLTSNENINDESFQTALSLMLDVNGEMPQPAVINKSVFLLDDQTDVVGATILGLSVTDGLEGINLGITAGASASNQDARLASELGILSFAMDVVGKRFIVARKYADKFGPLEGAGEGSLVEVKILEKMNPLLGITEYSYEYAPFLGFDGGSGKRLYDPLAMTVSADGSTLYVIDSGRILSIDLQNKAMTLVSSSSPVFGIKGDGPRISVHSRSIALDPVSPLLYLANGSGGVLAVNLATGDRFVIAN